MARRSIWFLLAFLLGAWASCSEPSIDLSGHWKGSARLIVDGEEKSVALRWDLNESEGALVGTIMWDDYRRDITSASVKGPKVRIESSTAADDITFEGLFKNNSLNGRFAIKYSADPEPFPGRFSLTRQD